jgi:peptidyl-prolyl cis-trans isomerase D
MYGGELPTGREDAAIKEDVIQGMVRAAVLEQEARRAGYQVGDQALLEELTKLEAFQTNGQFDEQRYRQVLQAQQLSVGGFERDLRRQIGMSYFEDGLSTTAFLPPRSRRLLLRLENQRRDFTYFVIPADRGNVKVSDKKISQYYKSHRDQFLTPERVKLAYVELTEKAVMDKIRPKKRALFEHYQAQADRYIIPEQRRARHILIKIPEEAKQQAVAKARRRAQDLLARLQAGEDFATVAKQHSQDALSAASGGELGFIARGDLDPAVETALFSLKKGGISDPVKTGLGFQIIQLVDVRPAKRRPFEKVRADVARDFRRHEAQERFLGQVEQLLTLSYEQSSSLEPAAEALGIEVQQTGWVSRGRGSGIAASPKFRNAAFEEDVLQEGFNSDVIEIDEGRVAVLRVIDHEKARPQPLKKVRQKIERILAVEVARAETIKAGRRALAELRDGKNMDALAKRYRVAMKAPGFIERADASVPRPVVTEAFALDKPSTEAATFGGTPLAEGYAVIRLQEVRPGKIESDQIAEAAPAPTASYGQREREAAYRALEAAADIDIIRSNL